MKKKNESSERYVRIETDPEASSENNQSFGIIVAQHQAMFEKLMLDKLNKLVSDVELGGPVATDEFMYQIGAAELDRLGPDAPWRLILQVSLLRVLSNMGDSEKMTISMLSHMAIMKSLFDTFVRIEEVTDVTPNGEMN